MVRDKTQTIKKILDAVGSVLSQQGAQNLGINAIAREAGVDKTLIYRYFGGFDELLHAYAKESSLWPEISDLMADSGNAGRVMETGEILEKFLINQLKEIRRRKVTQEVLRAEVFSQNKLTNLLAEAREKQKSDMLNKLSMIKGGPPDRDIEALLALINAAFSYMVVRSRYSDKHMGIDLHSNFGWKRLERLASNLINTYCGGPSSPL